MDAKDYIRLTGDARANDLALWPAPGASADVLQAQVLQQARQSLGPAAEKAGSGSGIRCVSALRW